MEEIKNIYLTIAMSQLSQISKYFYITLVLQSDKTHVLSQSTRSSSFAFRKLLWYIDILPFRD